MLKSFVSRRLLLASAAALAVTPLWAQPSQPSYPSKPIRLVIGYAPGGSVDMVGRVIADILTKHLDATVVVENQAGAAGVIAAQRVVSSKADGYTLLAGSSNELAGTKAVNTAQKYDPSKDVTPIGLAALAPNMWVAGAHVPAKNIEEFVALVKKNPGKYSYGSPGIGSTPHFSGELIKKTAGLFITHIPYRGSAAMTTDLGGGNVDFAIISPLAAGPFLQNGRMKALGVTTANRLPNFKDVPALGEHPALKGYALNGWFALVGPKDLPPEILAKLQAALRAGLADPAIRQRLEASGAIPAKGDESLAQIIRNDMAKYQDLAKFANITE